jgi:hypothetical protein
MMTVAPIYPARISAEAGIQLTGAADRGERQ